MHTAAIVVAVAITAEPKNVNFAMVVVVFMMLFV